MPRSAPSLFASLLLVLTIGVFLVVPAGVPSWVQVSAQNVPRPAPGDRLFLKIDGVDGEVTEPDHVGDLALQSFSWGVSRTLDTSVAPSLKIFHIIMRADKATPILLKKTATRDNLPKSVLSIRNAIGQDYMKWTIGDAYITGFQVEDTAGQAKPTVSFDLNLSRIDVEYRSQLYNGGLSPAVKGGWDAKSGN